MLMEELFLIVGCVIGLGFVTLSTRALRAGSASKRWRQVGGVVRHVVIESRRGDIDSKLDVFTARVDFEYVFEDARYRNGQYVGESNEDRDIVMHCARDFIAGKYIDVYVDPQQPQQSTLYPGMKSGHVCLFLFGIGVLGFSLWRLLK
ncbi:DUF3592 domain-containing protein [Pseudoduganella sp. RAF53_2]|uniref:DUF3592 domain-containing protein n=1 Tax=unclassified Pseudoduganella TaxID=2637179 RepID=UPI003F9B731A